MILPVSRKPCQFYSNLIDCTTPSGPDIKYSLDSVRIRFWTTLDSVRIRFWTTLDSVQIRIWSTLDSVRIQFWTTLDSVRIRTNQSK